MLRLKFHQNLGSLMNISDLKITRNTNRTVVEDVSKQFFTITDYDEHGRVKSVLVNIKAVDSFRLELEYDVRNRIKSHKVAIGRQTSMDKVNYNAENGNVVGMTDQDDKMMSNRVDTALPLKASMIFNYAFVAVLACVG
jgi:teneurin